MMDTCEEKGRDLMLLKHMILRYKVHLVIKKECP